MTFLAVWSRAVDEHDLEQRTILAEQAAVVASEDDVATVVADALLQGTLDEQDTAARLLVFIARGRRSELSLEGIQRCVSALAAAVLCHHITVGIGVNAFEALRLLDANTASDVACNRIDLDVALKRDARALISALSLLGTEDAIQRLTDIAASGGANADRAQRTLDDLGHASPSRLAELAAEWREKRTPALLHRLHLLYTSRLRARQITAGEAKALLGRPDFEDSGMIAYAPNDGTALTLQKDPEGRIDGVHFA